MLERFAYSGHDVATGMYPKKAIHWNNVQEHLRRVGASGAALADIDTQTLKAVSLDYPIEFEFEATNSRDEQGSVTTDANGFARVRRAGAGFMMVSRGAVEAMTRAYPDLAYVDPPSGQTHWGFFHTVFALKGRAQQPAL